MSQQLSQAEINAAAKTRDILNAILDNYASGKYELPAMPTFPAVGPEPSEEAQALVAKVEAARVKYQAEIDRHNSAIQAIKTIGDLLKILAPFVPLLLSLVLCAVMVAGCGNLGNKALSPQQTASNPGSPQGGRDVWQTAVNFAGSGWPLAVAVLGALYIHKTVRSRRQRRTLQRQKDQYELTASHTTQQAMALAEAISQMQAGAERDELLGRIKKLVPSNDAWKELLDSRGLHIRRGPGEKGEKAFSTK
jgi:hypothetical protein